MGQTVGARFESALDGQRKSGKKAGNSGPSPVCRVRLPIRIHGQLLCIVTAASCEAPPRSSRPVFIPVAVRPRAATLRLAMTTMADFENEEKTMNFKRLTHGAIAPRFSKAGRIVPAFAAITFGLLVFLQVAASPAAFGAPPPGSTTEHGLCVAACQGRRAARPARKQPPLVVTMPAKRAMPDMLWNAFSRPITQPRTPVSGSSGSIEFPLLGPILRRAQDVR